MLLLSCFRLVFPGSVHLQYLPHSYFKMDQKPTPELTISPRRGAGTVMNARHLLKRSTEETNDEAEIFLTTSDLALVGSQVKENRTRQQRLAEVIRCLPCVFFGEFQLGVLLSTNKMLVPGHDNSETPLKAIQRSRRQAIIFLRLW